MTVLIICLLALISILPFWNFSLVIGNYLSFIPFILYSVVLFLLDRRKQKEPRENVAEGSEITFFDINKAFFFNFCFFTLAMIAFTFLLNFSITFFSQNVGLFVLFVLLTLNSVVTSPGFYICRIGIDRNSLKKSVLLLFNNILKYSFVYLALFFQNWRSDTQYKDPLCMGILIFYMINIAYILLVSKNYSLVEKILKIKYYKRSTSISKT